MSTVSMMISRALVVLMMFAVVAAPQLAHAGAKGTPKVVISPEAKAGKFANLSRIARAKLQRAKLAGMSVAANTGWAIALTAGTIYGAVNHNVSDVMIFGGFATYNGIQAYRKWRAEKIMNEE